MAKKQYDLCLEVMRRLRDECVLEGVVLIGSWCVILYEDYFKGKAILPVIRTRDIEFLVPLPPSFRHKTDLAKLLQDLGFLIDYKGDEGYIVLEHPDLILEFIVPAKGRESSKPYPIDKLGLNAQALRFVDLLARNTIEVDFHGVKITAPHPANFALQKLLIARRRKQKEKAEKDRSQAIAILNALNTSAQFESVRSLYRTIPASWQQKIRRELIALDESDLLELMTN